MVENNNVIIKVEMTRQEAQSVYLVLKWLAGQTVMRKLGRLGSKMMLAIFGGDSTRSMTLMNLAD